MDDFSVKALQDLMHICIKDIKIARYIYTMPPYCYSYARYSDWFREYLTGMVQEHEKYANSTYAYF